MKHQVLQNLFCFLLGQIPKIKVAVSNSVNYMQPNPLKILLMVHIRPQRHVSNKQIFADRHPTVSNLKLAARTQIPGQFSGTNQNSQRDSLFPLNLPLLLLPRHSLPIPPSPPSVSFVLICSKALDFF